MEIRYVRAFFNEHILTMPSAVTKNTKQKISEVSATFMMDKKLLQ